VWVTAHRHLVVSDVGGDAGGRHAMSAARSAW
jgi:hypothetical protein